MSDPGRCTSNDIQQQQPPQQQQQKTHPKQNKKMMVMLFIRTPSTVYIIVNLIIKDQYLSTIISFFFCLHNYYHEIGLMKDFCFSEACKWVLSA